MSDAIEIPNGYTPRSYQMDLWQFLEGGGKRAVGLWHRRAGKDLLAINYVVTQMVLRPGLYWHLLPTYKQGRKIVWNGRTKEGRPFLDAFPKSLIDGKNNTDMTVRMKSLNTDYSEGSVYQVVGTDDIDSLVGANPVGCVFSEYSLQDPRAWDYIRPILMENGGWALFIYTARGNNHGKRLYDMAMKRENWFVEKLVAGTNGTQYVNADGIEVPVVTNEQIQEAREEGYSEAMIQQEFYNSFDTPVEGSYYGTQMRMMEKQNRITKVPHEATLEVHTAWDLGMDDKTAIIFFQLVGREIRLIDYYENSGEGLPHYAGVLREMYDLYGKHYFPWDVEVREIGTGKSRKQTARELGMRPTVVKKHGLQDGIEVVRNTLSRMYIDEDRCEHLVDALRQYHKEEDEKKSHEVEDEQGNMVRQKGYRNKPAHDWTSHPADAMRYLCMGISHIIGNNKKHPTHVDSEYDILDY